MSFKYDVINNRLSFPWLPKQRKVPLRTFLKKIWWVYFTDKRKRYSIYFSDTDSGGSMVFYTNSLIAILDLYVAAEKDWKSVIVYDFLKDRVAILKESTLWFEPEE